MTPPDEVAKLRAENTRLTGEVNRLYLGHKCPHCVATGVKLRALEEEKTRLRAEVERMHAATKSAIGLFDAIVANVESIATEPLTFGQRLWTTTIECHAKVGAEDLKAALGLAREVPDEATPDHSHAPHVRTPEVARFRRVLLDAVQSHDCAGRGECWCDDAWPILGIEPGRVDLARRELREATKEETR